MEEVFNFLKQTSLDQYHRILVDNGFDRLSALFDITEEDLEAVGMKRGHRRILQRAISLERGLPRDQPLLLAGSIITSGFATVSLNFRPIEDEKPKKRKYRRHPKQDPNAPERPLTAYQLFSAEQRSHLIDHNLSFAELSKAIGERWQTLDLPERRRFEERASVAKEEFLVALENYKTTDACKEYQEYLQQFKKRQMQKEEESGEDDI